MRKFLLIITLLGCAALSRATSITGTLQVDSSWQQEVYLSLLNSFDEINLASDDLLIGSATIAPDGRFDFGEITLDSEDRIYRLHICKKGDPISTIIIGGREHNHVHFILRGGENVKLYSAVDEAALKNAQVWGYAPNTTLQQIAMLRKTWKDSKIRSERERELVNTTYQQSLMALADTSTSVLASLFAIRELELLNAFESEQDWLASWLNAHDTDSSLYLDEVRLQFQFLEFKQEQNDEDQQSGNGVLIALIIGGIVIVLGAAIWFLRARKPKQSNSNLSALTIKERQVFDLLRKGLTNKEIAAEMHVEPSTIKSHVSNIYTKLEVSSRVEVMDLEV